MSFKCFKHPLKTVEAVCTESFCNHYRFFCVTCFLEHTPHFTNHRASILEINEVLQGHQNQIIRINGVSDIDTNLQTIKKLMVDYENLIITKRNETNQVIKEIERKFDESKKKCIEEVTQYLDILINKQQTHYNYLKKRVEVCKLDMNMNDWRHLRKSNSEREITMFFENLIKSPLNSNKEFKNEVKLYVQSFQRNIQELENLNNQKLIQLQIEEISDTIQDKFNDLKEVLIVPSESFNFNKKKIKTNDSFQFKSYKSPADELDQQINMRQQNEFNQVNNSSNFAQQQQQQQPLLFNQQSLQQPQNMHQHFNGFIHPNRLSISNASNSNLNMSDNNIELENEQEINDNGIYNNNNFNLVHQQQQKQHLNDHGMPQFQKPQSKQIKQQNQNSFYYQQNGNQFNQQPQQLEQIIPVTHNDGITSLIIYDESISGKKMVATGSLDASIMLWQITKQGIAHIKTLLGHAFPVNYLERFYKDGVMFLASSSQNHEIKIWNPSLSGNELITTLLGHFQGVQCLKYFDDFLISGSKDKTIKVWDLAELKCNQTINQDQPADCLQIYEGLDKQLLISTCGDGFRIFNYLGQGKFKLKSYNNKAHRAGISFLKLINNNNEIDMVTSGIDGLMKLWNLDKAICVGTLRGHSSFIYKMLWNPLKQMLFTGSIDGLIKVWNLKDCIQQIETNHQFKENSLNPYGDFIYIEEFSQIISVSNGNNLIKSIDM